ncbi:MAG: nucleoside hydrolase [Pirellulaceae bacterium]
MQTTLFCGLLAVVLAASVLAADPKPITIILDTDIGTDVDDAFALGLILASPELELRAVTTSGGQTEDRAWLVCRFITQCGKAGIPVAAGAEPQAKSEVNDQIQYRRHPAAIFNRTLKPVKEPAAEVLFAELKKQPGEVTVVAVGPLTNVARLLTDHPEAAKLMKGLVIMGGSVFAGYSGKAPAEPEWNIKLDVAAARKVLASGIPLTIVPLDATSLTKVPPEEQQKLFAAGRPLAWQVANLLELWNQPVPTLFDPVAVASMLRPGDFEFEELQLTMNDQGLMGVGKGKPNARVAVSAKQEQLVGWIMERITSAGEPRFPAEPKNLSQIVPQGNFPSRVHVAEDYDTDIERRWWMSGKAESKDLPKGSKRACRAVLTQDFDDLQGDKKTMYRAVIFNPVPGPPMGPNTRLSFKYKLHGTSTLRVQLYSLSNGYHRNLSVKDLPQDKWEQATVDMTQLRRPDGSGGPLSADERIDDIQFYIDPRAELLIDDVVLFDAAEKDEKRPFPSRILFTGWFDTGKQGQEWPGTFDIVPHDKPRTWKYAKSVPSDSADKPGSEIRLGLRGERPLGKECELKFLYHLEGKGPIDVEFFRGGKPLAGGLQPVSKLQTAAWTETTLKYTFPSAEKGAAVDEIRFGIRGASTLKIDDLLLYEN